MKRKEFLEKMRIVRDHFEKKDYGFSCNALYRVFRRGFFNHADRDNTEVVKLFTKLIKPDFRIDNSSEWLGDSWNYDYRLLCLGLFEYMVLEYKLYKNL